jgi:cytochrome c oxidase subunit II
MRIHALEKVFLAIAAVLLGLGVIAVGFSVFVHDVALPHPYARIDPKRVALTPPFDQPGLTQVAPGQYAATIIAQIWQFTPFTMPTKPIQIKAGDTITFMVTSTDVTHGFMITNTDINAMIVPGEVTRLTYTFTRPGQYLVLCHEYCGLGHQQMYTKVIVA